MKTIREAALYAAGLAEGLALAADLEEAAAGPPPATHGAPAPRRPTRSQIARPVMDILRTAGKPLRIAEIMAVGRSQGHDLLRDSVAKALAKLISRGIVVRSSPRHYMLLPPRVDR